MGLSRSVGFYQLICMIWFIANATGLHLRCRYPDTPEARRNVGAWLDAVHSGLRDTIGD